MKKIIKNEKIVDAVLITILFLYSSFSILLDWLPRYPDPFGYLSNAAYFAGIDWTDVSTNMQSYYSWGYSFILSFFFRIFKSFYLFSKVIFVLNCLFICFAYILLSKISKHLWDDTDPLFHKIIAFISMLYPAYTYDVTVIIPELFALIMFLLSVLLLIRLEEHSAFFLLSTILFAIITGFLPAVHGRNISCWAASLITITIGLVCKKIRIKQAVIFFPASMFIILIYRIVEKILKSNVYYSGELNNTSTSVLARIGELFSFSGLKDLITSFFTQQWYLITASMGLYFLGIILIISTCINALRNLSSWRYSNHLLTHFYITFSIIGVAFLSSFTFMNPRRMDQVLYGRHNEMFMSIMIVYGFHLLREKISKKSTTKLMLFISCIYCLITIITFNILCNSFSTSIPRTIIGTELFYNTLQSNPSVVLAVTISLVLLWVITFFPGNSTVVKIKNALAIILLIAFFIFSSQHAIKREYSENSLYREKYWKTSKIINTCPNSELLAISNENIGKSFAYLVQILAYKKKVEIVHPDNVDMIDFNQEDVIIYSTVDYGFDKLYDNCYLFNDTYEDKLYFWYIGDPSKNNILSEIISR